MNSSILSRFWAKVDRRSADECWLWLGERNKQGYGRFTIPGRNRMAASRALWMLTKGDPGELFVCHSCDNPPCCNPSHLFVGTALDNTTDMIRKGRNCKGEATPSSKLTEQAVREIKASQEPHRKIARRYGVSERAIRFLRGGETWAHIEAAIGAARVKT